MKYIIFGNGWIGNALKAYIGEEAILYKEEVAPYLMEKQIEMFNSSPFKEAEVWINTAAQTNIDWCEQNKRKAFEDNVLVALRLAEDAKTLHKKYVFFSSACIFESKNENDVKYEDSWPNPGCYYSLTKWMAEEIIQEANPDTLIVRPRIPISSVSHPRNTLDKLVRYENIQTNQESMTVLEDMIPALLKLIAEDRRGIYHLVNEGTISPAELADFMGHEHKKVSKRKLDSMIKNQGRPKRVTTIVGSKKIPLMPDIRKRAQETILQWKTTLPIL